MRLFLVSLFWFSLIAPVWSQADSKLEGVSPEEFNSFASAQDSQVGLEQARARYENIMNQETIHLLDLTENQRKTACNFLQYEKQWQDCFSGPVGKGGVCINMVFNNYDHVGPPAPPENIILHYFLKEKQLCHSICSDKEEDREQETALENLEIDQRNFSSEINKCMEKAEGLLGSIQAAEDCIKTEASKHFQVSRNRLWEGPCMYYKKTCLEKKIDSHG